MARQPSLKTMQEDQRARLADILVARRGTARANADRLLAHNARLVPGSAAADKYARAGTEGGLSAIFNP